MKIYKQFLSFHFAVAIACCLSICLNSFAVVGQPAIVDQRCLGGSMLEIMADIIELPDGNFMVIGTSESINGDVTGNIGGYDMWVVKLDTALNIIWQQNYGGTLGDNGIKIIAYPDGGFVFAGVTESNDGDVSGFNGLFDFWIVRVDSVGSILWQRCIGGSGNESGQLTLDLYPNGDLLFGGDVTSSDGDIDSIIGGEDVWLARIDSVGNILWQSTLGGTNIDELYSLVLNPDGNIFITGYSRSNNVHLSGNHGLGDAFLMKLDSVGNFIWSKSYGGGGEDYGFDLIQLQDSGFVIVGSVNSTGGDISGFHGFSDGRILRLDKYGNILWQRCLGGTSVDALQTVIETSDHGFLVGGNCASTDGDATAPVIGDRDVWFLKIDGAGNILWNSKYGGSASDYVYDIKQIPNGNFICIGSSNSNNYDVSGNHGGKDGWVWKFSDIFNTVSGGMYYDVNNDTIQSLLEPLAQNTMMTETHSGKIVFTTPSGNYRFILADSGSFNIQPVLQNSFYSPFPDSQQVLFPGFLLSDTLDVFHLQPTGAFDEYCIYLSQNTPFRPGQDGSYTVSYTNTGTTMLNADITFFPGNFIVIDSSSVSPYLITQDSIVWNIGTISPFQNGNFIIYISVDTIAVLGDVIESSTTIGPVINFNNRDCNTAHLISPITASYDPNNIIVDKISYNDTISLDPPRLFYRINFQNVGTDTAFNVVVNNYLDADLNMYSFDFIGASHPMQINYNGNLRIISFAFDSIILPDSNTNEMASRGYIIYEVKPVTGLISGDTIVNMADIYFDYNFPVRTNNAITIIETSTGIANLSISQNICNLIFPNPAQESITLLKGDLDAPYEISVINNQGSEVIHESAISDCQIDISTLKSGVYIIKIISKKETCFSRFVKLPTR